VPFVKGNTIGATTRFKIGQSGNPGRRRALLTFALRPVTTKRESWFPRSGSPNQRHSSVGCGP
jgi:hypothetical protein